MKESIESKDWEAILGQQIRSQRLRLNIDQLQLSKQAGVALNAVKNLESGKGATISSLVKVLRALNREEWLGTLAPIVSISPLQMLKAGKTRQRAFKTRGHRDV